MSEVNYDYPNQRPLPVEVSHFDGKKHGKEIVKLKVPEVMQADYQRAVVEIINNYDVLADPNDDNMFVGLTAVNEGAFSSNPENLTVIFTTWTSSVLENVGNVNEFALKAAAMPDTPFLIVDNPGMGKSSPMNADERQTVSSQKSFWKPSMRIARTLESSGYMPRKTFSTSLGGRYGLGFAMSVEKNQMTHVVTVDPPGVVEQSPVQLLNAMLRHEMGMLPHGAGHNNNYALRTEDPFKLTDERRDNIVAIRGENAQKFADGLMSIYQKFVFEPIYMGRELGLNYESLKAATKQDQARHIRVSLEESELIKGHIDRVYDLAGKVGHYALSDVIAVPGTHAMTSSHPSVMAGLAKHTLES